MGLRSFARLRFTKGVIFVISRRAGSAAQRQRIERAIELYLRDCYRLRTAARVSELAQNLGISRPYLSRMVPAILGISLREALRRRQLDHAASLLAKTRLPIHEIALRAAFGHQGTFFRVFRKAFGESPDTYRSRVTNCE